MPVDALLPVKDDAWDVVEVKSGTNAKEEYLDDVAFQRYCYAAAGLIDGGALLLVDEDERSGEISRAFCLFREEDVTGALEGVAPTVEPNVNGLLSAAHSKACPERTRRAIPPGRLRSPL